MCGDWFIGPFILLVGLITFVVLYPLPTWIVLADPPRQDRRRVMKMNLLLGWTVLGWVTALVFACRGPRRYHDNFL